MSNKSTKTFHPLFELLQEISIITEHHDNIASSEFGNYLRATL